MIWSDEDVGILLKMFRDNFSISDIARRLNRSPAAVCYKLSKTRPVVLPVNGYDSDDSFVAPEICLSEDEYCKRVIDYFLIGLSIGAVVGAGLMSYSNILSTNWTILSLVK